MVATTDDLLDRVLVKDRLESKLRLLRCQHRQGVALDRVLVKDRLESKLRPGLEHGEHGGRWFGSWSKIGLRANSDYLSQFLPIGIVGSGPGQRSA